MEKELRALKNEFMENNHKISSIKKERAKIEAEVKRRKDIEELFAFLYAKKPPIAGKVDVQEKDEVEQSKPMTGSLRDLKPTPDYSMFHQKSRSSLLLQNLDPLHESTSGPLPLLPHPDPTPISQPSQDEDLAQDLSSHSSLYTRLTSLLSSQYSLTRCTYCLSLFCPLGKEACIYHPGMVKYYYCKGCGQDEFSDCCGYCDRCSSGCMRGEHYGAG